MFLADRGRAIEQHGRSLRQNLQARLRALSAGRMPLACCVNSIPIPALQQRASAQGFGLPLASSGNVERLNSLAHRLATTPPRLPRVTCRSTPSTPLADGSFRRNMVVRVYLRERPVYVCFADLPPINPTVLFGPNRRSRPSSALRPSRAPAQAHRLWVSSNRRPVPAVTFVHDKRHIQSRIASAAASLRP